MAATTTLSTTTLASNCGPGDVAINVASVTNITPGLDLFLDWELMKVVSIGLKSVNGGTMVNVLRGRNSSHCQSHNTASTMYIGRPDQFYEFDPKGAPPVVVLVSPHINVVTGGIWWPQGDEQPNVGPGNLGVNRWWQRQVPTYGVGPLGVGTVTQTPSSGN